MVCGELLLFGRALTPHPLVVSEGNLLLAVNWTCPDVIIKKYIVLFYFMWEGKVSKLVN